MSFRVDATDIYHMSFDISYTSKHFTDQYNSQLAQARDRPITNLRSKDHEVTDTIRKIIYKKQLKTYKFESNSPIDIISKKIEFVNNSYFVQVSVQNSASNRIFIDNV